MRRQNFNSSGRCANSHNGAQYPETSHPRQPYGGNLADQTSVPDRMNSRKIQRTEKPEADWPALRLELTASLNRRKATTFPGSTRLGHKDPGGRTEGRKPSYFVVHPTDGRGVCQTSRSHPAESSARSFQRRSLPFILANWYSNNTGSSSHRHDRSFKLVRYH